MTATSSAQWLLSQVSPKPPGELSVTAEAAPAAHERSPEPITVAPRLTEATAESACEGPTLSAREILLLLELGSTAERAYASARLRCTPDQEILAAAVAWYLDRNDYETASHWAEIAAAKGWAIPPWERMLLALHQDDREQVAGVLHELGHDLPISSRIEALRYLGDSDQALKLARSQLASTTSSSEREQLVRLTRSMELEDAPSIQAGLSALDYGPLSIRTLEASGEISVEDFRVGLKVLVSKLDSSSQDALSLGDVESEQDVSLTLAHTYDWGQLSAEAGANLRTDHSVAHGSLRLQRPLKGGVIKNLSLGLAINDPSYETALCRAFCTKSYVSAGVSGGVSPRDFFHLTLDAARYQTRDDERLATGLKLDGAIGYRLVPQLPQWDVSLRGVLQENDLASRAPDSLKRVRSGPVDIDDVLPSEYRFLGLGTSLQGNRAAPVSGQLQYTLDAYTGWQWPANEPSYGVQMSLATPLLSWRDYLTFSLAYASALAGGGDNSYKKVSLTYGYRF